MTEGRIQLLVYLTCLKLKSGCYRVPFLLPAGKYVWVCIDMAMCHIRAWLIPPAKSLSLRISMRHPETK